jgi:hypothetical protein
LYTKQWELLIHTSQILESNKREEIDKAVEDVIKYSGPTNLLEMLSCQKNSDCMLEENVVEYLRLRE